MKRIKLQNINNTTNNDVTTNNEDQIKDYVVVQKSEIKQDQDTQSDSSEQDYKDARDNFAKEDEKDKTNIIKGTRKYVKNIAYRLGNFCLSNYNRMIDTNYHSSASQEQTEVDKEKLDNFKSDTNKQLVQTEQTNDTTTQQFVIEHAQKLLERYVKQDVNEFCNNMEQLSNVEQKQREEDEEFIKEVLGKDAIDIKMRDERNKYLNNN